MPPSITWRQMFNRLCPGRGLRRLRDRGSGLLETPSFFLRPSCFTVGGRGSSQKLTVHDQPKPTGISCFRVAVNKRECGMAYFLVLFGRRVFFVFFVGLLSGGPVLALSSLSLQTGSGLSSARRENEARPPLGIPGSALSVWIQSVNICGRFQACSGSASIQRPKLHHCLFLSS